MKAWVLLMSFGCAELAPLGPDVCGNGVVDPGEECDTLDPSDRACVNCRLRCATGEPCPEGWTCGADEICRHPSGRFERLALSAFAPRLGDAVVADVDGDGLDDLVGSTDEALSWWRGGARGLEATEPLGLTALRIVAGDLDDDGRSEIVVSTDEPFGALSTFSILRESGGRLSPTPREGVRTSLPEFVPSPLIAFSNRIALASIPDALVAFHLDASRIRVFRLSYVGQAIECSNQPLEGPTSYPLIPAVVPAVAPTAIDDPEVLIAIPDFGRNAVILYRHSFGSPPCELETPAMITPTNPLNSQRVHFADFDGDGTNDILFGVLDDLPRVAVALGTGGGTFGLANTLDTPNLIDRHINLTMGLPCFGQVFLPTILAAADFDGDGQAELVSPSGIYLRDTAVAFPFFAWSEAAIADFNGDGHEDVAAIGVTEACDVAPGLELFLGDGRGDFVRHAVFGPALPHTIVTGDFDGDRITDLALGDGDPDAARSSVWIFYGDAGRGLVDVRRIEFEGFVESLAAFRSSDGFHDLVAITANGPRWLTEIRGNSARVPDAPIAVPTFSEINLAVGPIDLARGDDILVSTQQLARLYSGLPAQRPGSDLDIEPFGPYQPIFAVAPGSEAGARGTLFGATYDNFLRVGIDAFGRANTAVLPQMPRDPRTIGVTDLDGDGPDVIVEHRDGPPVVFPHALQDPLIDGMPLASDELYSIQEAKPIQLDVDPERELVLLATGEVRLAEWTDGQLQLLASPGVFATHVEVGDFDGDGFDDIVIADGEGLTILHGCPHDDPCP